MNAAPLPPPPPDTASGIALREILVLAQHHGLATGPALAAAGIAPETLADLAAWIPLPQFEQVLSGLITATADPAMPVKMASQAQPGTFGLVSFIAMVAPTMGEVIERAAAFERLLGDFASTQVEIRGAQAVMSWDCRLQDPDVRRAMTEGVLAAWTVYARWLLNDATLAPIAVLFRHSAHPDPAVADVHARIFSAPVHFDQPLNALVLPASFLARPLRQPDPVLFRALDAHARQRLASGPAPAEPLAPRTAQAIRDCITEDGVPRKETVAARLGLNPRTLLRHLHDEGTHYQALLDEVRRELALALADDADLTPAGIASRLGFGDVRSLQRCFRRWTGSTLAEYRAGRR